MSLMPVLGRIISHGYLATGFLPLRITFPSLVNILLGPTVTIPDNLFMEAFKDSISCYEASILKEALLVRSDSYEKKTSHLSSLGHQQIRLYWNANSFNSQTASHQQSQVWIPEQATCCINDDECRNYSWAQKFLGEEVCPWSAWDCQHFTCHHRQGHRHSRVWSNEHRWTANLQLSGDVHWKHEPWDIDQFPSVRHRQFCLQHE